MSVVRTRYGAQAYDALCRLVAEAKAGDPLRPVTVLVPTHLCGVIARRALAHGDGRLRGVAGISVVTVDRLAERVGAPVLSGEGRRPETGPVLAAAWRRALGEEPGVFGPVAGHPATVRALVAAHRELREVDERGVESICARGDPITVDLVRLYRRVLALLAADWYDVADLRRVARAALRAGSDLRREIGVVVVFLPQDLSLGAAALVESLASTGDVRFIAAETGDMRADRGVLRSLARSQADIGRGLDIECATATRVAHASDSDDEVRCMVRMLVGKLRQVPAHRIAVLYGSADPYARLLSEHLAAAGIVSNGVGVRPTVERALARMLIRVLALPEHRWRREEVLAVLASAPVRDKDGNRVPASRWDRVSRAAGVVSGDDWDRALRAYAVRERAVARADRTSVVWRADGGYRPQSTAEAADALRGFVVDLQARLAQGARLRSWPELAVWARGLFHALVGDVEEEPWLPEDEADAARKVERILTGLVGLASVEPGADLGSLRSAMEVELAEDLPWRGRFGEGVLVAPLSSAIGLDADAVFVVGLSEDLVPGRLGEDALLPERVRVLTGGQLALPRDRLDRQHRHLLAALAAAPESVVSFPRGDLRHSASRLPSRWLLPSLRTLSGDRTLAATRWESVQGPWLVASPSYASGLAGTAQPATEQEWRTRAAMAGTSTGGVIDDALPEDKVVTRALALLRGRASDSLTRFDGDLSGLGTPDPCAADVIVSPTSLEEWSVCPHGYFLRRLLGVEPLESPEELVEISPQQRGNLVHDVLDRFFTEQESAGGVPGSDTLWTARQRSELRRIALEVAAEFEARGVVGHPLMWRQEEARILDDLGRLLDDDDRLRRETGRRQVRSELAFGTPGTPLVVIALPDGRSIRFRGSADRVDRAGEAIVVVDYKTGRPEKFKTLSEDNPTADGTKLQLPVYAYAARSALGMPRAEVRAEYWFLRTERGKRVTVPLTPDVDCTYAAVLAVIADGIADGLFPHRPPTDDSWSDVVECRYCDPDGLGVSEHRGRWRRKRHDPRLAAYLALVEPHGITTRRSRHARAA